MQLKVLYTSWLILWYGAVIATLIVWSAGR